MHVLAHANKKTNCFFSEKIPFWEVCHKMVVAPEQHFVAPEQPSVGIPLMIYASSWKVIVNLVCIIIEWFGHDDTCDTNRDSPVV